MDGIAQRARRHRLAQRPGRGEHRAGRRPRKGAPHEKCAQHDQTGNGERRAGERTYRADRNFHGTVDRYLTEFERLLEDVSRDERGGQAMVRTYLTSETGKVYTLLAHASGRFD